MNESRWFIPPSTLHGVEHAPRDRPVAMLIRHSVREHLPPGEMGYEMPITADGRRLAVDLGRRMYGRLMTVHSSPVRRTVQTAECMMEGSGRDGRVVHDRLLGDPGVFVLDSRAGETWRVFGHEEVLRKLGQCNEILPGCADADAAARFLVSRMLSAIDGAPGLHGFVTHDSVVVLAAARLLGVALGKEEWPKFLEAAFFWREGDKVHVEYRGNKSLRSAPLTGLAEADVIGLARREVAATLGLRCQARYFLAGGMFKTLLHGVPPRDLDVWACSEQDRIAIRQALLQRGAIEAPKRPYSEAYSIHGRTVELSDKVDATTLEDRLLRFDLAVSAVGVEHTPTDCWRASIHPLAIKSVQQRRIHLLPELKNWRHCLTSIERLRRYSRELGYCIHPEDERRLWSLFRDQNTELQSSMLERFHASSRGDQGMQEDLDAWHARPRSFK